MTSMDKLSDNLVHPEHEFFELSDSEIIDVSGGIIPIVIGAVWAVGQISLAVAQREYCGS